MSALDEFLTFLELLPHNVAAAAQFRDSRDRICYAAAFDLIRESERADADAREQLHIHHGDRP